jgi:PAS domain S-box-containing protein
MVRFSITKKFILAFLVVSILPIALLGFYTSHHLWIIGQRAIDSSGAELETRARESIELRAIELANRASQFLQGCEGDLLSLRMLPRQTEAYQRFSRVHRGTIWTLAGSNDNPVEVHLPLPLYREIAFVGADGWERLRVEDDRIVMESELREVGNPRYTTFKCESYFAEARKLRDGEIYVSHVTGWFVTQDEQLQGARFAEQAVEGKKYEGIIRLATPVFDGAGEFAGLVVLALDHRHIMELTQHIIPTSERFVVFPSYSSGNYAFMFDDEGWMISHPKFWNIRGVLADGSEFDPTAPYYNRDAVIAGKVPFNLDHVAFISSNYPLVAREVRAGRSGVTSAFNVGGTSRVMAYAPIFYDRGAYSKFGVFGGITIGVETSTFLEPALLTRARIDEMVTQSKQNSLLILALTALVAIFLAVVLARTFTRPIFLLADKAQAIAAGEIPETVSIRTGDELEMLAGDFAYMASEVRKHQNDLERSLAELAESKKSVEQYTRELEKQVRLLKNVHYLSHYLGNVFDIEMVLQMLLKTSVEGLGFDRALIYLYDPAARRLLCRHTFGFSPKHEELAKAASYDVDRQDCIPTKVFHSHETIFVRDIGSEARATTLDRKISEVGESDFFVFTPIRMQDQVFGILGADTATSGREFSEAEVESLQIVANDAARAIERSQLYGRLLSERNFIKSILTHMTSGVIALDEIGRVTWLNPYSQKVFQISQGDALGRHYREVFRQVPGWVQVMEGLLQTPETPKQFHEHHLIFEDGNEKYLEVHFSNTRQEDQGEHINLLFLRDISQRKMLEGHLRRSDRLISLGVLAAGFAHEMRNPLTGISLLLDDLHDHLGDRPEERDMIQKSLKEIDRLENLIDGILDFAAPSRRTHLVVRPVGDVVQATLFLVTKQCKNQNIRLTVQVEDSLPPVNLDPERLQQALLNLLLNAIQAMPDGGTVSLEAGLVNGDASLLGESAIRIAVRDTGRGIGAEDLPYIFDPFFTRNPGGTGLGLAIVHSIVEEHGGRISVSSQVGQGASFWMDLPVVPALVTDPGRVALAST